MSWKERGVVLLMVSVLAAGCAAPGPATTPRSSPDRSGAEGGGVVRTVKRISVGSVREQETLPTAPGQARLIQPAVNSGLTIRDGAGGRRAILAQTVPSLENGLWKVLPDGRMETTWQLRDGVQWHDGAPFRSDDLLFTLELGRDRDLAAFSSVAYPFIDQATAPDARTLVVTWKQPYIDADTLFDLNPIGPLPRHRLETAYRDEKATFLELPFWGQDYVGVGPFRIREWVPGVGVRLDANPAFVLGRPKIDEVEIKYIADGNAMLAGLLAGAVDATGQLGSIDLGLELRDQWRDGVVVFNTSSDQWLAMFPQLVDPRPALMTDLRFRQALAHGMDRQEYVDTVVGGMSPVPHSLLSPNQPQYREIEASIPKYGYDPRRAAQLLEEVGYRRDPAGAYRDAAGARLELEIRNFSPDPKHATTVASYWEQLGLATTPTQISSQRAQDLEYVATFPALLIRNRPNDVGSLRFYHSSQTPLASNSYRIASPNHSRYMSPELDALIDGYFTTVSIAERTRTLGQIVRHVADQVTVVGLFYNPIPGAFSSRLVNAGTHWYHPLVTWNIHEWDAA